MHATFLFTPFEYSRRRGYGRISVCSRGGRIVANDGEPYVQVWAMIDEPLQGYAVPSEYPVLWYMPRYWGKVTRFLRNVRTNVHYYWRMAWQAYGWQSIDYREWKIYSLRYHCVISPVTIKFKQYVRCCDIKLHSCTKLVSVRFDSWVVTSNAVKRDTVSNE